MATKSGASSSRGQDSQEQLDRVFKQAEDPVMSAPEVADELGISQQAAHKKLQRAHMEGTMNRKKVGARAVVWWK